MTTNLSVQDGFIPGDFVIFQDKQKKSSTIGIVANNEAKKFLLNQGKIYLYNNFVYTIILALGCFSEERIECYEYGSIFSENAGICKFPFFDVLPTKQLEIWNPSEENYFRKTLTGFIITQREFLGTESCAEKLLRSVFYLPPEKVEVMEIVSLLAHFIKFEGVIRNKLAKGEALSVPTWVKTSPENQMKLWEQLPFLTSHLNAF